MSKTQPLRQKMRLQSPSRSRCHQPCCRTPFSFLTALSGPLPMPQMSSRLNSLLDHRQNRLRHFFSRDEATRRSSTSPFDAARLAYTPTTRAPTLHRRSCQSSLVDADATLQSRQGPRHNFRHSDGYPGAHAPYSHVIASVGIPRRTPPSDFVH